MEGAAGGGAGRALSVAAKVLLMTAHSKKEELRQAKKSSECSHVSQKWFLV